MRLLTHINILVVKVEIRAYCPFLQPRATQIVVAIIPIAANEIRLI